MSSAIGVVMTGHIVAGRLEDNQLAGKPVRFPADSTELDALLTVPGGELVEIIARLVAELVGNGTGDVSAIGVAGPGVSRHGIVEDSTNIA